MKQKKGRGAVTWILLFLAVGMLVYGAAAGQAEAVFTKAVKICMECIGLG